MPMNRPSPALVNGLSREIAQARNIHQIEARYAPAAIPRAPTIEPRFVEPPPPFVPPTAQPATNAIQTNLLVEILGEMRRLNEAIQSMQRMEWVKFASENTRLPDRTEVPTPGSAGNGASYTTTWTAFWTNNMKWPVGIAILATWVTPGGALNFSYSPGTSNQIVSLANGGVNGGTFTSPLKVMPGQTVFFQTNGIALAAGDTFFVGVYDPSKYVKRDAFGSVPFGA